MTDDLTARILEELGALRRSSEGVEAKQDNLQKSFEGLETKFEGLEAKQDNLQKSFEGLETKFEGLETKQDNLQKSFEGLETKFVGLDRFQVETAREFSEVRSMIPLSYSQLDRRLRTLEDSLEALQSRVMRLETATAN